MNNCVAHNPVEHLDGNPWWCRHCGMTAGKRIPTSYLRDQVTPEDNFMDFMTKARLLVAQYYNLKVATSPEKQMINLDDVYIVWFTKTIDNWKAMVSTTAPDGLYYEVTYDGALDWTYIDVYKKCDEMVIRSDEQNEVGS